MAKEEQNEGCFADNVFMSNLLYICQNNPKTEVNDGFPLARVMFRIVNTCLNLIETKSHNGKHSDIRNE